MRLSVRYWVGYVLVRTSGVLLSILIRLAALASIPQRCAAIVWTPRELDRYARARWNDERQVREYAEAAPAWMNTTERDLVERYLGADTDVLNLACGTGREAMLLARRGIPVTACDWSLGMVEAARSHARGMGVTVRFLVSDLFDLPWRDKSFDCLFLTNSGFSYVMPRRRRTSFLRQAHAVLRTGGLFIVSFSTEVEGLARRRQSRLFVALGRFAVFNREFESGDAFVGGGFHLFRREDLMVEFEAAGFQVVEWTDDNRYAVLRKP